MYYIYKIENKKNSKKYIGLTNNPIRRRCRHFSDLKRKCHDNSFLQKEFIKFGESAFDFQIIYESDCLDIEIGEKEREYIALYDSYLNGYNQNEGGSFRASNGGSTLIEKDLFIIFSVLEFSQRPGQLLSDIFEVSRTTISRIKRGENHNKAKEKYEKMSLEERKDIYRIFAEATDFEQNKNIKGRITSKRKLTEEQVHLILINNELKIKDQCAMARFVGVKSTNTLITILREKSYKDYSYTYKKLTEDQKQQLASLLSN